MTENDNVADLDTSIACTEVIRSQKALLRQRDELPLSATIAASVKVFAKRATR